MHALPMALEGTGQGRGKAPGRAALAADQDHGLGHRRRHHSRQTRAALAALPPDQPACHRQDRHGQRGQAKDQPPKGSTIAGVKKVDPFPHHRPRTRCLPGQHLACALIDIARPRANGQREHILCVPGIGKGQIAQVGDGHFQGRHR
jgi:hypothetical protein